MIILDLNRRLHWLAMGSNLHLTRPCCLEPRASPGRSDGIDDLDPECLTRTDGDRVGGRCDGKYESTLAIGGRCAESKAPPLPDCEAMGPGMLANLGTCEVNDVARPAAELPLQEACGVSIGDEANVVTVRLACHGQAALLGLARTSAL